jgi:CheY-like chemotaxis protein
MPEKDGWDILSILKNDRQFAAIPVIMMSMNIDKQKGYANGALDCLDKTMLHSQIPMILKKHHVGEYANRIVMIVDDEPMQREFMTMLLEDKGLQTLSVENGQQALIHLEHTQPVLILLDLNMPVMNGFQLLEHLRKHSVWRSIPVVVLTSKNLSAEEYATLNQHTETIFQKADFQQQNFLCRIRQLVRDTTAYKQHETATDLQLEIPYKTDP